jgi:hypothetical protein
MNSSKINRGRFLSDPKQKNLPIRGPDESHLLSCHTVSRGYKIRQE